MEYRQLFSCFVPDGADNCHVTAWMQPELPGMPARCHPAMIICPGGGYVYVSEREAIPVAKNYYAAGYNTFILDYSVQEHAEKFEPLCQLAATVAHIRRHAEEFHIDPSKVAVSGFSAGGHLAASLGVLHNNEQFLNVFAKEDYIRPDALVLSYPVITADQFTHKVTLANVSGEADPGSPEYCYWGLESHVDAQTPPTFIWHTAADAAVPVENSLIFSMALSKAKVPFELHIFPSGAHGLSVCNQEVGTPNSYNERWIQWSIKWLNLTLDWNA